MYELDYAGEVGSDKSRDISRSTRGPIWNLENQPTPQFPHEFFKSLINSKDSTSNTLGGYRLHGSWIITFAATSRTAKTLQGYISTSLVPIRYYVIFPTPDFSFRCRCSVQVFRCRWRVVSLVPSTYRVHLLSFPGLFLQVQVFGAGVEVYQVQVPGVGDGVPQVRILCHPQVSSSFFRTGIFRCWRRC